MVCILRTTEDLSYQTPPCLYEYAVFFLFLLFISVYLELLWLFYYSRNVCLWLLSTVIRASVPKLILDDAFEQKDEIAKAVEEELEKAMSAYGFEIVQTLIVDIEPDEHVKRSMNEINAGLLLDIW